MLTAQHEMHPAIAIAHAGLADLLYPAFETGLPGATRTIAVGGSNRRTPQARRTDTFHVARISSTSLRLRAGLRAFA